jgi:thiamine-phosphate diphosphorylase
MSNPDRLPDNSLYLITSGQTTVHTTPATEDFLHLLKLVRAAVAARIDLIQIREKNLSASVLYELATTAARITNESPTRLLINDRSDIAAAAGADGVHLTTTSLPTAVVRQTFGDEFLIGVSVHSLEEAVEARQGGADFAVFGPVFETASKQQYGSPPGLAALTRVSSELAPFPILAIGGVSVNKVADCITAGARGVAAITMLQEADELRDVVKEIRRRCNEVSTTTR